MLMPACDPPLTEDSEYARSSAAIADIAHRLNSTADPANRVKEFEKALAGYRWPFAHATYTTFLDDALRFITQMEDAG